MNPQPRYFPRLNPDSALNPALFVLILCVNPTNFLFRKFNLTNTLVIYTFWNRNISQQLIVCTPPVGCCLQFERTVQDKIRQTGVLPGFRSGVVYSKMKVWYDVERFSKEIRSASGTHHACRSLCRRGFGSGLDNISWKRSTKWICRRRWSADKQNAVDVRQSADEPVYSIPCCFWRQSIFQYFLKMLADKYFLKYPQKKIEEILSYLENLWGFYV